MNPANRVDARRTPAIDCDLAGICSGCPRIDRPLGEQRAEKVAALATLWVSAGLPAAAVAAVDIVPVAAAALRDRVDLSVRRDGGLLISGLDGPTRARVIDIERCPLMTEALAGWYAEVRSSLPDVESGAMRLRVSPLGDRGIWLDVSRADAERLVDDGDWLRVLAGRGIVEIGQRHRRVVVAGDSVVLGDAVLDPWFETYVGARLAPAPLYLPVGGFSQPGFAANRLLVGEVLAAVDSVGAEHWLELGAGSGNFTLPLASRGRRVTACELDPLARAGLARSLDEAGLAAMVDVRVGNFHRSSDELVTLLADHDAVLADPPRSGLMGVTAGLRLVAADRRPAAIVYVSCFAATLVRDAVELDALGYRLTLLRGVDLFPHSDHCEWVAVFAR